MGANTVSTCLDAVYELSFYHQKNSCRPTPDEAARRPRYHRAS